jgi:predicted nucleotidyltransferase
MDEAIERLLEAGARSVAMPGRTHLRLVSLEDLLLLKCLADRPQDRADVVALLSGSPSLDQDVIEKEAAALELELPEALRFQ